MACEGLRRRRPLRGLAQVRLLSARLFSLPSASPRPRSSPSPPFPSVAAYLGLSPPPPVSIPRDVTLLFVGFRGEGGGGLAVPGGEAELRRWASHEGGLLPLYPLEGGGGVYHEVRMHVLLASEEVTVVVDGETDRRGERERRWELSIR